MATEIESVLFFRAREIQEGTKKKIEGVEDVDKGRYVICEVIYLAIWARWEGGGKKCRG